jgi:Na+-transporting methylmalonyl-CoA/oxaloacetate decarboxylase gamma subunit
MEAIHKMQSTGLLASGVGILFIGLAIVLAILYLLAPLLLYGIYSRLGRLVELQEYAVNQAYQQNRPRHEAAEAAPVLAGQWSKL